MTGEFLTHVTKGGDRWDLLAAEYYGSAFAMGLLLEANPAHAALPVLPAGLALAVPVVEQEDVDGRTGAAAATGVVAWR